MCSLQWKKSKANPATIEVYTSSVFLFPGICFYKTGPWKLFVNVVVAPTEITSFWAHFLYKSSIFPWGVSEVGTGYVGICCTEPITTGSAGGGSVTSNGAALIPLQSVSSKGSNPKRVSQK